MSGRAKSAPMLKRKEGYQAQTPQEPDDGDLELDVIDYIDESRDVVVPEAALHDINVWPHLHGDELMDKMFPTAMAVPEIETIADEQRDELGRLHRRWAAVKIGITRG